MCSYFNRQILFSFLLIFTISASFISCDSDSNNSSDTKTVFTENDFGEDFELEADARVDTCVTFLEPPDGAGTTNTSTRVSDGVNGTDVMPIAIGGPSTLRICWEDDNGFAEHDVTLMDSEGNEILFHVANDECVSEMVEGGSYNLIFAHDGNSDDTHAIYVRPPDDGDTAENTIELLITTDSCEECFLSQGDFEDADLSNNNLKGADLTDANFVNANLYRADLTGAATENTNFSRATAPNGGTFPPNSFTNTNVVTNAHEIMIENKCSDPVWLGILFGAPASNFPPSGIPPFAGNSWEIPSGESRSLFLPEGFESGVMVPRTGCVLNNMCCTDATGKDCSPASTQCSTDQDCINFIDGCTPASSPGCQQIARNRVCASNAALRCDVGTCGDLKNCGQQGKGAEPSTTFEMSLDTYSNGGDYQGDFYNVSMVAGNHVTVKIEPMIQGTGCDVVGNCSSLPKCPWARIVQATKDRTSKGILNNYDTAMSGEIGACLAADKVVAANDSRYTPIPKANPFQKIMRESDDDWRLRCAAPNEWNCGDDRAEGFFGCSPFTIQLDRSNPSMPVKTGDGCITDFGAGKSCNINGCEFNDLIRGGQGVSSAAYSRQQICDPHGQCDSALNRTGRWPMGEWPADCIAGETGPCSAGGPVNPLDYISEVHSACGQFTGPGSPKGAYAWAFDDPEILGLSGGLASCKPPAKNMSNYKVTFCN